MKQTILQSITGYFNSARQRVLSRKKTALAILIVLFGIGYSAYAYLQPAVPSRYVLALARKDTVVSSLSGTGQVLAENQLDVKPANSGVVVSINVANGQSVREGQVIAMLDQRSASVSITQARASLASAEANLAKLKAGATGTDLQSSILSVTSGRQDLATKVKNVSTQADNLIRTTIDQMYKDPNSYITPQFQITFFDSNGSVPVILTLPDVNQAGILNSGRQHMTAVLAGIKAEADSLNSASSDAQVMASAAKVESYLNEIRSFLTDVGTGVNALYFNTSKYKSTVDSYKSTVASARNTADSLYSDLVSSEQSFVSSQSALEVKKAPSRPEDISTAEAQVESARASLQSAQIAYANNVVVAPFDGIIAGMTIHKGDTVGGSTAVATLITKQKIAEIPLNEVDAAKVQIGQKATLTFDALPDLSVAGQVSEIDPLGTVAQGVVTYNVKISFDTQDDRVKPNMSVSAAIVTGLKQDVVTVPNAAIQTKSGASKVSVAAGISSASGSDGVLLDQAPTEVTVTTGLSNDTVTEIVTGIKEGDAVVTKTITGTAAKAASTAQSGLSLLGGNRGAAGGGAARTTGGGFSR